MKASRMIRAGAIAFAAMFAAEPARAALTLIAVGGGGGGAGTLLGNTGGGGVISESGTSGGAGGGAGGTGGLGGAGADAGGGAGWLGNGGNTGASGGGLSAPTFAGGGGFLGLGNGGFGGGGGSGFAGGGGGGGYSGGGGAGNVGGGGGGGSYLNPATRDTIETPDFNGVAAGNSASNGYVIVGLTVFNYTGTVVEYTIPTTGFYYVAAVGAQGGSNFMTGGYGAGVGGSVFLDMGTELDIVVGGAGVPNFGSTFNGGGGGGSFVWDPTAIPRQPAVPEASTWAMMLLGFGGLGYAGFRRRVALAAPAGFA